MDKRHEDEFKRIAESFLKKGRDGDWAHTLRAIEYGRYLLATEKGEEDIVIPALYLHDIGWSAIDYSDFVSASPALKKETKSLALHMHHSAVLARKILREMRYDTEKAGTIVSIIAVHDDPQKIFDMENLSATLVVEADRMDRYGPESILRYKRMFGQEYLTGENWQEAKKMRLEGLDEWFRTDTARKLSRKLATTIGLFE